MNVSIHADTKRGQTDLGGHNNTVFVTSTKRNKYNDRWLNKHWVFA